MRKITTNPSTFQQLAAIEGHFNKNDTPVASAPKSNVHYHEYYRVESDRGFVKITLPKKGFRR